MSNLSQEELYDDALRRLLGEELAAICRLPLEERIEIIAEHLRAFDTRRDLVWPAEGYTGPDLP